MGPLRETPRLLLQSLSLEFYHHWLNTGSASGFPGLTLTDKRNPSLSEGVRILGREKANPQKFSGKIFTFSLWGRRPYDILVCSF